MPILAERSTLGDRFRPLKENPSQAIRNQKNESYPQTPSSSANKANYTLVIGLLAKRHAEAILKLQTMQFKSQPVPTIDVKRHKKSLLQQIKNFITGRNGKH